MRSRPPVPLAVLILLALSGCEAGHRAAPGSDNALAGPTPTVVAPRPGQVVPLERLQARLTRVQVLIELIGAQGRFDGDRLWMSLDGGAPIPVTRPGRAFPIDVTYGTHVLRTWVTSRTGEVRHHDGGHAVRVFHVGAPGTGPLQDFDEQASLALTWAGQRTRTEGGVELDVLLWGPRRASGRALLLEALVGGRQAALAEPGHALPLCGLGPGRHEVEVRLLEHVRGPWGVDGAYRPVQGPLTTLRQVVEVKAAP